MITLNCLRNNKLCAAFFLNHTKIWFSIQESPLLLYTCIISEIDAKSGFPSFVAFKLKPSLPYWGDLMEGERERGSKKLSI